MKFLQLTGAQNKRAKTLTGEQQHLLTYLLTWPTAELHALLKKRGLVRGPLMRGKLTKRGQREATFVQRKVMVG